MDPLKFRALAVGIFGVVGPMRGPYTTKTWKESNPSVDPWRFWIFDLLWLATRVTAGVGIALRLFTPWTIINSEIAILILSGTYIVFDWYLWPSVLLSYNALVETSEWWESRGRRYLGVALYLFGLGSMITVVILHALGTWLYGAVALPNYTNLSSFILEIASVFFSAINLIWMAFVIFKPVTGRMFGVSQMTKRN